MMRRNRRSASIVTAGFAITVGALLATATIGFHDSNSKPRQRRQPGRGFVYVLHVQPPASVWRSGRRALTVFYTGRRVAEGAGCAACHRFGRSGKYGPGKVLTDVGDRLSEEQIARVLANAPLPMPSVSHLSAVSEQALVNFLMDLRKH